MEKSLNEYLQDFAYELLYKIVNNKKYLEVKIVSTTKNILVQVKADEGDYGKIIGRQGKTIESLRTIINCVKITAFPDDCRRVMMELEEERPFVKNHEVLLGGTKDVE